MGGRQIRQGGSGFVRLFGEQENQNGIADRDLVSVTQLGVFDCDSVDEGAIAAVEIANLEGFAVPAENAMAPRKGWIADRKLIDQIPADADLLCGERNG